MSLKAGASIMMGQASTCLFSHGWVGKSWTEVELQTDISLKNMKKNGFNIIKILVLKRGHLEI